MPASPGQRSWGSEGMQRPDLQSPVQQLPQAPGRRPQRSRRCSREHPATASAQGPGQQRKRLPVCSDAEQASRRPGCCPGSGAQQARPSSRTPGQSGPVSAGAWRSRQALEGSGSATHLDAPALLCQEHRRLHAFPFHSKHQGALSRP